MSKTLRGRYRLQLKPLQEFQSRVSSKTQKSKNLHKKKDDFKQAEKPLSRRKRSTQDLLQPKQTFAEIAIITSQLQSISQTMYKQSIIPGSSGATFKQGKQLPKSPVPSGAEEEQVVRQPPGSEEKKQEFLSQKQEETQARPSQKPWKQAYEQKSLDDAKVTCSITFDSQQQIPAQNPSQLLGKPKQNPSCGQTSYPQPSFGKSNPQSTQQQNPPPTLSFPTTHTYQVISTQAFQPTSPPILSRDNTSHQTMVRQAVSPSLRQTTTSPPFSYGQTHPTNIFAGQTSFGQPVRQQSPHNIFAGQTSFGQASFGQPVRQQSPPPPNQFAGRTTYGRYQPLEQQPQTDPKGGNSSKK